MSARRRLRRLHVWLGWLAGVPLLFWTVSGLWMAARQIEEVRGGDLRASAPAISIGGPVVAPATDLRPLKALSVEPLPTGPVWLATFRDGGVRRASLATGRWLPPVGLAEARAIAVATYAPRAAVLAVTRTTADVPPIDLRRARPAWRVAFGDGTHVYVDADSGQVLALRTRQWRWYDWMWRLHIMDLGGREATHSAVLVAFAALAALTVVLALVLLPLASRSRWR